MRSNISNIIKTGVRLIGFSSDEQSLDYVKLAKDPEGLAREEKIAEAIDKVSARYGSGAVKRAALLKKGEHLQKQ
mgnify:CR=1 FL=1